MLYPESGINLFRTLQEQLKATRDPRDAERAELIGVMLAARRGDLTYHPNGVKRLLLRNRIPSREKTILGENGVTFYILTGETIEGQRAERTKAGLPAFWHIVDAGDRERLLALPSRRIEIGIFSDPKEFFVPNSFGKDTDTQERLAEADAKDLSTRLKLKGITQILADEASTLTELVFRHQAATGQWLFGPEYATAQGKDWVYGRTKNPTNSVGSNVANVGSVHPAHGLRVFDWDRGGGHGLVGAPRLVVSRII